MEKSESLPSSFAFKAATLIERIARLARSADRDSLNPAQWEALRYLARANRFSRTPAALADYLGSTRGTVSQTLMALETKGYLTKSASARDRRSIDLDLTPAGRALLDQDALKALAQDIELGADAVQLSALLEATLRSALTRRRGRAFGACHTCKYFRTRATPDAAPAYYCSLLDEPLTSADAQAICVEQCDR